VTVGGPAGAEAPPAGPSAEAVERWELKIESSARIGVALTIVGALLHLVGVVSRSFATDPVRVPWGNMYEFTVTGTLVVVVAYLALLRRLDLRWLGLFLTAFVVVTLMAANLLLIQEAGPLVPALHSYWLVIHVGAAMVSSGAFSLGALASAVFLLKARSEERQGIDDRGEHDRPVAHLREVGGAHVVSSVDAGGSSSVSRAPTGTTKARRV
jgi:ABC-type transport system involved in cytochrome c biogenesis permease subunit